MSYSKRSRYSRSPSPYRRYSRSVSRSLSRSLSRSRSRSRDSSDVENPGNNLYVTGLSPRITKRDLEKHFATEGKVEDVHLVVDPWTRESRGFGFVTMCSVTDANRCIKYLNRSVLEGRVITVEKAKRRRGRTPTPGKYLGLRTIRVRRRSPSYSPYYSRSRSPHYSSDLDRSRSPSPHYRRRRSYSYYSRRGSYSPYYSEGSRSPYSGSPVSRRDRSYSPYFYRHNSPDDRWYRRGHYRSISRSTSPVVRGRSRRSYSGSVSPRRRSYRSYSRSVSPGRSRSYSRRISPRRGRSSRRSYSRSISPRIRSSRRSFSRRLEHSRGRYSSRSCSRSPSGSPISRSETPRSGSPSY